MTADNSLLFRNTMRVLDGHLNEFREAIREAVEFAKEHGPQLLVHTFLDEPNLLAYSYQLYLDSESVLLHWKLSDPYIAKVMAHCTVERFEVYGQPSAEVLDGLRRLGDTLAGVTPRIAGFTRFPAAEMGS
jgi:hypothetical protein